MFAIDRAKKVLTLVITCLGFFMVLLDVSIVTVALPTMQADLHVGISDLQWIVDAYTLPFAVLLLTAGTLGDRFGRKRLFLVGLAIFTIGSALCGFAPTLGLLIAGRILQGIGGAALAPGSLSVLAFTFPDERERAQAIGIWSGVSGIALAAGPLIGGSLIQLSSWPAIFFVNLPIGIIAFVLGWRVLAESRNPLAQRADIAGQILIIAGLTALTYAFIEGKTQGWTSTLILTLFILAAVFIVAFLAVEAKASEPLLPLSLFHNRTFSTANGAAAVVGFALLGTVFFLTQYFQGIQGYNALGSGLRTLPNTIGIFLAAPLAGQLTARFGPRLPVTIGAFSAGIALLLLTSISPTTAYVDIWWKLAMLGGGFGLMLSPLTTAVLAVTPPARAGLASSIVTTSRQIGSVLGIALLGTLVNNQFTANITSSLTTRGVPEPVSQNIATAVANAGSQANKLHFPATFPIPMRAVHALLNQAFTNAIHEAFLVSGVALLCTGILSALLLGRGQKVAPVQHDAEDGLIESFESTITALD
ncbi:MFS transporter [Dictyobacter alpinus]|uniref:MFS transporter n=1 Tax=Dictyobacter alpinus TaxID=2014873 RepID=A0A402BDV2_9CHLR|nr:MFS transporter [Dictyobacter alpinus]GCE29486.1 MFS transporter [Dictyobacter alpinus]